MTSAELLAAVRSRFDDAVSPYLASDALILEQASLTQTEFARTTLALYDVESGTVTAGDPWLDLPDNFCVLKTVILDGLQLRPITISELDFGYYTFSGVENTSRFSNWRAATGTPKFVVTDMYPDKVRLVPYPSANGTVSLEGYTIPADLSLAVTGPPAVDAVNPEIPEMYHELLLAGTLLRLYSLFDPDIYDAARVQIYANQWFPGLIEAQNNLRTSLRRQVRLLELPRGFVFDAPMKAPAVGTPVNES